MRIEIKTEYKFKQPLEDGTTRCSIIHNGEYVFSPTEASKVRPDLVEEYKIKKVYYENLEEGLKEIPDYDCWDSDKKVLIKQLR